VRKNCIGKITQVKENEKIRVDFSRERLETWCKSIKKMALKSSQGGLKCSKCMNPSSPSKDFRQSLMV
jgi:CBS-domain-containing membrane protein